jgi:hypothetical protein
MKKLLATALLLLFTISTAGLQSKAANETALAHVQASLSTKSTESLAKKGKSDKKHKKEELKCECKSRCSLRCLKNEHCMLSFDVSASNDINTPETLAGNFLVTVYAPNGEIVATMTIDASTIGTFTNFAVPVKAPICAGFYTVEITNQNVTVITEEVLAMDPPLDFQPFIQVTVTSPCNPTQSISTTFASFEASETASPFPVGSSLQQIINILPPFVHFEKCETECECKKKKHD